jgi:flavorubredoxin
MPKGKRPVPIESDTEDVMKAVKLKDDIYWVGGIDWSIRDFHGYLTQRGSTYNAYLIIDEKITLIDTVKHYLKDEMLERISDVIDPSKIDYVISNHVEMDHSGCLPDIIERAGNPKIFTSPNGEKGLKLHYKKDWNFNVVKSGDRINIGKRNLDIVLTPMVHWPDNMVAYCGEDKILFSNDAFGQHIATTERLDSEYHYDIIIEEAKKYYANIVLPYSNQVMKALEGISGLDIEMIAPSHGIIWNKKTKEIIEKYTEWASNETKSNALIVYDTMWNSTEKIAMAIYRGFQNRGVHTKLISLRNSHISDIMTDMLTAKYICIGSPTLNMNLLPTVAGFLSYFRGLAPKKRIGLAFGSYGWAPKNIEYIEETLKHCKFEILDSINVQYIPDDAFLEEVTEKIEKIL